MNNDQLTPGPWRWKFSGTAGNYFLYGNDGKGPIVGSGPDCADGRLMQAAPALLAKGEAALIQMTALGNALNWEGVTQEYVDAINGLRAAIAEARGSDTPPRGQQG